ncbi:hypothetical protein LSH36_282g03071, partial [Paralvinella palmiformis]
GNVELNYSPHVLSINICIQPNLDTRKKQLDAWCSLILNYHRQNKQYTLDVTEALVSPIFYNKAINRKLSEDAAHIVLEELRKRGNVEWTDKSRKQCLVMWRTPEEWGKLIYQWVSNNGMVNTVCTLYELAHGDDTDSQGKKNRQTIEEFHGLEDWLLKRALETLEQKHKAEIISYDGSEGVKFFS